MARAGVEERSLDKLQAAFGLDPGGIVKGWSQKRGGGGIDLDTMALPEAARVGWAEGVELLARLGADPSRADADRQGFGEGREPIVEALSKGHFGAARALFGAGARLESLGDLVWAATLQAHRKGARAGVAVLDWIGERGVDPWADDEKAKAAQSSYLFAGSLSRLDARETEEWEERLFRGMGNGEGADACLWSHMFGLGAGVDKSPGLCRRHLEMAGGGGAEARRALKMLEWALRGGCPWAAGVAARRVAPTGVDWEALGGAAIEAAAAAAERGHQGPGDPKRKVEAVRELWAMVGPKLGVYRQRLERACAQAMLNGDAGLFEGVMEVADLCPAAVLGHWRQGMRESGARADSPQRSEWERCAVVAMSKRMGEPGAEGARRARLLFEAFDPPGPTGLDQARFERLFAQAESQALGSRAPMGDARGSKAARVRL